MRSVDWFVRPRRLSRVVGWALVFFVLNIPPFTILYFVLAYEAFVKFSLLYLGEISILAMVAGLGSWWQSLQVQEHQEADADVQEVLDELRSN